MSRRFDLLAAAGAIARFRRHDRRGWIIRSGLVGLAALVASTHQSFPRLVWNASASAPIGLYWVDPVQPIGRGDLVLARLPDDARRLAAERRYLPANVPVVKRVVATPGDVVCSLGNDITINGRNAVTRLEADGRGRPLPGWTGCRTLGRDEVFLLMESVPDSFDGRYFGPVETSRIIGRLVPLWTR